MIHQLTKVTLELEDTLASLGKADSMITKLKDLIAERDRHASAERVRQAFEHEIYHNYDEPLTSKEIMKAFDAAVKTLTRALPPSTGEKAQ